MTAIPDSRHMAVQPKDVTESLCACCGQTTWLASGHVFGQNLFAAYFVQWTLGRVPDHGAHFDLVFGEGDRTIENQVVVSLWSAGKQDSGVMVIDANQRPLAAAKPGKLLTRDEVIGTRTAQVAFAIFDAIWMLDHRLTEVTGVRILLDSADDEDDKFRIVPCTSVDAPVPGTRFTSRHLRGSIQAEEGLLGDYFVHWTLGQAAEGGAELDIVLGGDEPDERVLIGVQLTLLPMGRRWALTNAPEFEEIDGQAVVPLRLQEIIGTDRADMVLDIAEAIWRQDARLDALDDALFSSSDGR